MSVSKIWGLVILLMASPAAFGADGVTAGPKLVKAPASQSKPEAKPAMRHGVFRYTNYGAAWTYAQKSNRPILVFATAPSCPHCVRMIHESYQSPQIKQFVNDSFETVYVDRTEQPSLTAKMNVKWFPTTVIVGPNNQVLDVIEGYVDSKTLAHRLQTSLAANKEATQKR
jgi:thioredoxin-like negative regulator of GroEL